MFLSVVICTHNRAATLRRAFAAVERLESPAGGPWELVLVDNASTDDTKAVTEELAARANFSVRYILEPKLGHSVALNAGVRASGGEVIAFTDDDALPDPGWLRAIETTLARDKADWVFGPVTPEWDGPAPGWFNPKFNPKFALVDYGPTAFRVTDPEQSFFGVNHACKRAALDTTGLYREDMGLFGTGGGVGNDIDLFHRALAANLTVVYDPAVHVRHMIAPARTRPGHWRQKILAATGPYYAHLRAEPPAVPWLLGLPRFYFRTALADAAGCVKAAARLDRSEVFFHELKLLRFGGLLFHAARHKLRPRRGPAAPRTLGREPT